MKLATMTVDAGLHRRRWCPVTTSLDLAEDVDLDSLVLVDVADQRTIPVQAWRGEGQHVFLAWMVRDLAQGASRAYDLVARQGGTSYFGGVDVSEEEPGRLAVRVNGQHVTTYNYWSDVVRPYLYPVFASGGVGVTRNWPMVADAVGETNDHPHHKGIYTAQGSVNGVDNWSEGKGHGYQVHREFARVYGGVTAGGFTEELDWTDANRDVNMTETRRLTFYATSGRVRLFDYEVNLHASHGEVTLGDTKEGGLLSIRVASSMDVTAEPEGGRFVNGYGGVLEGEAWGKRAPWCDYSGPTPGGWKGVTLMDHVDNPRYPTHWHVRNYGLMTANPIGLHDFTGDPENRWDLVIPEGETLSWLYRVMIHDGDATDAQVADRYHDFANPPIVAVAR